MDDLFAYVRGLLVLDPELMTIFAACGLPGVDVRPMNERIEAAYPRLLLDVEEGAQFEFGENNRPKFVDGQLHIEFVTEQSQACPEPFATLMALRTRTQTLLLGDVAAEIVGLKGSLLSDKWSVTRASQSRSRRLLTVDPNYHRHRLSVSVQLCRREL